MKLSTSWMPASSDLIIGQTKNVSGSPSLKSQPVGSPLLEPLLLDVVASAHVWPEFTVVPLLKTQLLKRHVQSGFAES